MAVYYPLGWVNYLPYLTGGMELLYADTAVNISYGFTPHLIQDNSCPGIESKPRIWFRKRDPTGQRTCAGIICYMHFICMLILVDALYQNRLERLIYSLLTNCSIFAEQRVLKHLKVSIHQILQNCKIFYFFSLFLSFLVLSVIMCKNSDNHNDGLLSKIFLQLY